MLLHFSLSVASGPSTAPTVECREVRVMLHTLHFNKKCGVSRVSELSMYFMDFFDLHISEIIDIDR